MTTKAPARNLRPAPDKVLTDIADYVLDGKIGEPAMDSARLVLTDTLACALDALDHPECTKLLGPPVPRTIVSNAWVEVPLALVRHAPNTGWRKSWAAADASASAMRLAQMAVKGEMGYPAVLTAKHYGFYDASFRGKPFNFQRRYGDYVIRHSMFKFVTAGMHGQSAVECALRLHPLVKDRLAQGHAGG